MKTLFTDLDRAELARLGIDKGFDAIVGPEEVEPSRSCVGCFGCWTKTPGVCVLKDGLQRLGETLARTDELQIVSRCTYGGYSRTVKAIIDRCIPYVHPCFRMLGGEMHHRLRYDRTIRLRVCLYGPSTAAEREALSVIAGANARNLGMRLEDVWFPAGPEGVLERESAPCASGAPRVMPSAAAASDGLVLVNASPKGERSATKILLSGLSAALLEKGDTVTGTVSCPARVWRLGTRSPGWAAWSSGTRCMSMRSPPTWLTGLSVPSLRRARSCMPSQTWASMSRSRLPRRSPSWRTSAQPVGWCGAAGSWSAPAA